MQHWYTQNRRRPHRQRNTQSNKTPCAHPTWLTTIAIIRKKHNHWLPMSIPWVTIVTTDTFGPSLFHPRWTSTAVEQPPTCPMTNLIVNVSFKRFSRSFEEISISSCFSYDRYRSINVTWRRPLPKLCSTQLPPFERVPNEQRRLTNQWERWQMPRLQHGNTRWWDIEWFIVSPTHPNHREWHVIDEICTDILLSFRSRYWSTAIRWYCVLDKIIEWMKKVVKRGHTSTWRDQFSPRSMTDSQPHRSKWVFVLWLYQSMFLPCCLLVVIVGLWQQLSIVVLVFIVVSPSM
jgi:hypothetical protein